LARRAAGDGVDGADAPCVEALDQLSGVGEVAVVPEPAEVAGVGLDRSGVVVGADYHVEPGIMKTEAEAARAREQVDRRGPAGGARPAPHMGVFGRA
jgi:hypothetical protein